MKFLSLIALFVGCAGSVNITSAATAINNGTGAPKGTSSATTAAPTPGQGSHLQKAQAALEKAQDYLKNSTNKDNVKTPMLVIQQALTDVKLAMAQDSGSSKLTALPPLPEIMGNAAAGRRVDPARDEGINPFEESTLIYLAEALGELKAKDPAGKDPFVARVIDEVNYAIDNVYMGIYLRHELPIAWVPAESMRVLTPIFPMGMMMVGGGHVPPSGNIISSVGSWKNLGISAPTLHGVGADTDLQKALWGLCIAQEFIDQINQDKKGDYIVRARLGLERAFVNLRNAIDLDEGHPLAAAAIPELPSGVGNPASGIVIPPLTKTSGPSPNVDMALKALNDVATVLKGVKPDRKGTYVVDALADVYFAIDNINAGQYTSNNLPLPKPPTSTAKP